jgi:transposase
MRCNFLRPPISRFHKKPNGTIARDPRPRISCSVDSPVSVACQSRSLFFEQKEKNDSGELLKVEQGLWSFARVEGVAPTNNAVERALRHAVIWRRISGGTDNVHGSRFVERMLTVVVTCRQQGHNVLEHLTSCFEADRRSYAIPSHLPVTQTRSKIA